MHGDTSATTTDSGIGSVELVIEPVAHHRSAGPSSRPSNRARPSVSTPPADPRPPRAAPTPWVILVTGVRLARGARHGASGGVPPAWRG